MRKPSIFSFITCIAVLATGTVCAQQSLLTEQDLELQRIRETLANLELSSSRLDRRMLEPLGQFGQQLMDAGRFDEAHQVLDQAVQIVRVSEGLYSQNQFPYLLSRIENYGNQGDWAHASDLIEHLEWLLRRGENFINVELMDSILRLVDIHLWGVANDSPFLQSSHFRGARRLNELAIRAAIRAWGPTDTRLPEIFYKQVVQEYLQAVAVEAGGKTGIALRTFSEGGYARTRRETRISYYYFGLRNLNGIRQIYSNQQEPDLVGMAMAEMYIADWQVLFGNPDAAAQAYARSYELLRAAGIAAGAINRFHAHPKMIPALNFITDWDSALASLDQPITIDQEAVDTANFNFQQWSAQFPHYEAPVDLGSSELTATDEDFAMFSFNLAGLEEASRWYRGRLKKEISSPQDLELVSENFNQQVDWMELENAIMDFRFRPKLVDGVPQPVNATLVYYLAE